MVRIGYKIIVKRKSGETSRTFSDYSRASDYREKLADDRTVRDTRMERVFHKR